MPSSKSNNIKNSSMRSISRSRMVLQRGASERGEGVYTEYMTDAEQACNNAAESLLSGRIAFIGLGHMGSPMALNLLKAGWQLSVFDLVANLETHQKAGARVAASVAEAVHDADLVITMLPEGKHVTAVYEGKEGIFATVKKRALLIDCSTIDIESSLHLHETAKAHQFALLDAPVSGGTKGAAMATLTFMVGGEKVDYEKALPVLEKMGKKIFYAGKAGSGQAAKICNNMLLGISMFATSEMFHLADKLGLDAHVLHEIVSVSSGQCWSVTHYPPIPDILPEVPSSHDYEPGFTAKMMLKDLRLAQQAAIATGASTPLGAETMSLYHLLCHSGLGDKDFSSVYQWLSKK